MGASIRSGGNATAEVRRTLLPKTAQVLPSFVRRTRSSKRDCPILRVPECLPECVSVLCHLDCDLR
jgi:hypothetical protein